MSSGSLAEVESLAIQNSKTVSRRSGRGRLREVVVYDRFQYKALTEDIFGDLGRWLPARGGRTWRFGCIIISKLCLLRRHIADILHRGLTTTRLSVTFTVTGRGVVSLPLPPKHINSLVNLFQTRLQIYALIVQYTKFVLAFKYLECF